LEFLSRSAREVLSYLSSLESSSSRSGSSVPAEAPFGQEKTRKFLQSPLPRCSRVHLPRSCAQNSHHLWGTGWRAQSVENGTLGQRRELGLTLVRGCPSSRVGQQNSLSSSSESARIKALSTSSMQYASLGKVVELWWMKERKKKEGRWGIFFFHEKESWFHPVEKKKRKKEIIIQNNNSRIRSKNLSQSILLCCKFPQIQIWADLTTTFITSYLHQECKAVMWWRMRNISLTWRCWSIWQESCSFFVCGGQEGWMDFFSFSFSFSFFFFLLSFFLFFFQYSHSHLETREKGILDQEHAAWTAGIVQRVWKGKEKKKTTKNPMSPQKEQQPNNHQTINNQQLGCKALRKAFLSSIRFLSFFFLFSPSAPSFHFFLSSFFFFFLLLPSHHHLHHQFASPFPRQPQGGNFLDFSDFRILKSLFFSFLFFSFLFFFLFSFLFSFFFFFFFFFRAYTQ